MASGDWGWLRWYKKPSYVDVHKFAASINEAASSKDESDARTRIPGPRCSSEIPSKLDLEKILKNRTCSPLSLYDFYMYLKHIEYSEENLEFYIWFKNYEAGRLTAFPEPPQTIEPLHVNAGRSSSESNLVVDGKDGMQMTIAAWPLPPPDEPGAEAQDHLTPQDSNVYAQIASLVTSGTPKGPCSSKRLSRNHKQPVSAEQMTLEEKTSGEIRDIRHAELDIIKGLFLLPGSPKELNIPDAMRRKALDAIATSTEAEHLAPIAEHCHMLLQSCSHRNFVRLGVSNGTFETICMATGLGIVLTVSGFITAALLAFFSPAFRQCSRWRVLGVWPLWSIGVGLILSGLRGSCFFLLLFSRRQPLPWEKFEDDNVTVDKSRLSKFFSKLMIFDRKLKVNDSNLRRLQRKVVVQSLLGGVLFATVATIIALAVPVWKKVE